MKPLKYLTSHGLLAIKAQASIVIAWSFSSLSFLNAYLVGLQAKAFFRSIYIPISHNLTHYNGQLLLKSCQMLILSTYILWSGPILVLYFQHASPIF